MVLEEFAWSEAFVCFKEVWLAIFTFFHRGSSQRGRMLFFGRETSPLGIKFVFLFPPSFVIKREGGVSWVPPWQNKRQAFIFF